MSRYYPAWNGIQVLPEDLIKFAWSEPMRDLATKIGMSDVGLRKLFVSMDIAPPPQGYWNKLRAGKPVPEMPKAQPRQPGTTGRLLVDRRFEPFVPQAQPLSSAGPFASALVPEDLDELRRMELKAIGKAITPRSLEGAHPGLRDVLAKEAKRRAKSAESKWSWDEPKFDNPLDQRKLRIFNAIYLALARRGCSGSVKEDYENVNGSAHIGQQYIRLTLEPAGKHKFAVLRGYKRPDPELPAGTPLQLRYKGHPGERSWSDDKDGKLETKIAAIAADLIVAGEAGFRERLRQTEIQLEKDRIAAEERRRKKLEELNTKRLDDLLKSGELLRQAREIRELVANVSEAMEASREIEADALAAWREWALSEADKLDPILSGQIRKHLHPPTFDQPG
jgi:hypothetical protein